VSLPNSSTTGPAGGGVADPQLGALILAAGRSSRMQGFKPLLHVGPRSMLDHALALFQIPAVIDCVTVVGHRAEELIPAIETGGGRWVLNKHHDDGMFSSIQVGVAALGHSCAAFFLLPVDMCLVRPHTITSLLHAYATHPGAPVYYPHTENRRGHPPLIAARLREPILTHNGTDGLRGLLRDYEIHSCTIALDDPFILMDADTDKDLAKLRKRYQKLNDE
jgi:molybdenum cofactor cytidylyltransferase